MEAQLYPQNIALPGSCCYALEGILAAEPTSPLGEAQVPALDL